MRWSEEQYEDWLRRNKAPGKKPPANNEPVKIKSKYGNIRTTIDGIEFDSKKEAEYYCNLKLLKRAGEIKDFGLQPRYVLQPTFKKNGKTHRSITYVADFIIENNDGTTDVVDIKGFETQVFKIKQKLFEYMYPDLSLKVIK